MRQVIEERLWGESTAERQFVWGVRYVDELVLRDRDTTGNGTLDERLYALQDANYNVTAITDASGAVVQRFGYEAYGRAEVLAALLLLCSTLAMALDLDGAKAMFDEVKIAYGASGEDEDLIDHLDSESSFELDIGGQG